MVVLLRSTDGNPDSRFQKYTDFLEKQGKRFLAICWDRNADKKDDELHIYYHVTAKYGEGLKNIKKLLGFNTFIFKQLKKYRHKYAIIHAADFDTVIPATLMHILYRKHVIYDIYDWYIDSRSIKNWIIKTCVLLMEFFNIKCADYVIICEPERKKQIYFTPNSLWILPNIPNYKKTLPPSPPNKQLTIAYVGILGAERGLEKLISYAKLNSTITLKIAGFGPLESLLHDVDKYANIHFYGSVKYDEALSIMNTADIIYAIYETSNPNHILAAPNKYYEGLYLGKPILTTKGTIVGDKTLRYQTGFVIGETYDDLSMFFKTVTIDRISLCSKNAVNLWETTYSTYTETFLLNTYLPFINTIN